MLIALAVLFVLLLIRALLKRRMVGGHDEAVKEVREGLDARSLLGQRWREWWNRRRRANGAAPALELLDPNSGRARYREILLAAAEAANDLRRRPAETPAEYQARLHMHLSRSATLAATHDEDDNITRPTDTSIPEELTLAYERERYGGKRMDERKRTQLRAWVPQLLRRLVGVYRGHPEAVHAVGWSPDGKYIASGSEDSSVQVWDSLIGQIISTYRGHVAQVNVLAWSPDSKRIASGSRDKTVQVWDATTGSNVFTYQGHIIGLVIFVEAVAWFPAGTSIASGTDDGTVHVWAFSSIPV